MFEKMFSRSRGLRVVSAVPHLALQARTRHDQPRPSVAAARRVNDLGFDALIRQYQKQTQFQKGERNDN